MTHTATAESSDLREQVHDLLAQQPLHTFAMRHLVLLEAALEMPLSHNITDTVRLLIKVVRDGQYQPNLSLLNCLPQPKAA